METLGARNYVPSLLPPPPPRLTAFLPVVMLLAVAYLHGWRLTLSGLLVMVMT